MAKKYTEATVTTRRRAVGVRLTLVAAVLRGQADDALGARLETDQQFLSAKEREYLKKVSATLHSCETNLKKLAERLGE